MIGAVRRVTVDTSNPPFLHVTANANGRWIVARMDYNKKDDSYSITKTSDESFKHRHEAFSHAIDWADSDKLEIR